MYPIYMVSSLTYSDDHRENPLITQLHADIRSVAQREIIHVGGRTQIIREHATFTVWMILISFS